MPRSTASPGRTGRPPVTSRAQILAATRRLIDRDGWEKLTIRQLAAELGIGPTTLYHHVRDREDLLVQLINEQFEQVARPELPDSPRDRIVAVAVAARDLLAAWPWAAEVLTTDGFLSRIGGSALWSVETIVASAIDAGCTSEQAVHVFRNIWYYTVGEILVRANSVRRRDTLLTSTDPSLSDLDPSLQPRLAEIGDRWPELAAQDTYPQALRAFVDGLLAQATA